VLIAAAARSPCRRASASMARLIFPLAWVRQQVAEVGGGERAAGDGHDGPNSRRVGRDRIGNPGVDQGGHVATALDRHHIGLATPAGRSGHGDGRAEGLNRATSRSVAGGQVRLASDRRADRFEGGGLARPVAACEHDHAALLRMRDGPFGYRAYVSDGDVRHSLVSFALASLVFSFSNIWVIVPMSPLNSASSSALKKMQCKMASRRCDTASP
jgi:hypothetical protein